MWRRDRRLPETEELIADCGAFLVGSYAEHLEARGERVPPWAWTNLLAHGSEEELPYDVATAPTRPAGSDASRQARADLAGELLDAAERHGPLPRVQATALVPLELELAGQPISAWATPAQWVARVLAVLDEQRPPRRQDVRSLRRESTW